MPGSDAMSPSLKLTKFTIPDKLDTPNNQAVAIANRDAISFAPGTQALKINYLDGPSGLNFFQLAFSARPTGEPAPVPEPSSITIMGLIFTTLAGFCWVRKRQEN